MLSLSSMLRYFMLHYNSEARIVCFTSKHLFDGCFIFRFVAKNITNKSKCFVGLANDFWVPGGKLMSYPTVFKAVKMSPCIEVMYLINQSNNIISGPYSEMSFSCSFIFGTLSIFWCHLVKVKHLILTVWFLLVAEYFYTVVFLLLLK